MRECAGVLFVAGSRVLLLRRSDNGLWGFPGGHVDEGETQIQAIERECFEEIGCYPKAQWEWTTRQIVGDVDYTTYCRRVDAPFAVSLNEEHTDSKWFDVNDLPGDIMSSATSVVARLGMDETGVAKAIRDGDFTSPQLFANVYIFAMRVTGTGVSFRNDENGVMDEVTFRDPSAFLTDAFLERCNGLPVIWEHTDAPQLNSEEFAGRVIGTLFLPYIKGDEVWAIARVWVKEAAIEMASRQWSTSPGVRCGKDVIKMDISDDRTLMIEGKPFLLDHLAVCAQGVWDKQGPPSGVDATLGADMADEKVPGTEGAEGTPIAKDATCMEPAVKDDSGVDGRVKIVEDKLDRIENLLVKALGGVKDDAVAVAPPEDEFIPGEPLPEASVQDSAFQRPEFRLDEAAEKERKDEEARKDAERAASDARKDAALKALSDELASVKAALPREISDDERDELSTAEAKADSVYMQFGKKAPRPMINENPMGYRRRVAKDLQKHSARWKNVPLDGMPAEAFGNIEDEIRKDALTAAKSHDDVPAGRISYVSVTCPDTGRRSRQPRGQIGSWLGQFKNAPNKAVQHKNMKG